MSFDSTEYRKILTKQPNYSASPTITENLEWRPHGSGHTIFDKGEDEEPFTAITVGKVLDYKLNANPSGTYLGKDFGSLSKAKYQFYLTRPLDPAFKDDFLRTYAMLEKLQTLVAKGPNKKDMLYTAVGGRLIRFARSVFEERKKAVRDSPKPKTKTVYYEDIMKDSYDDNETTTLTSTSNPEEEEDMDEETKGWPVDTKFQDELDMIKPHYRAIPLNLYKNDKFIEPRDVNDELKNSLVEVHFTIHHTFIKKDKVNQDSFQARIQEVKILKEKLMSSSRRDPRKGPSTSLHHADEPSPSKKQRVDNNDEEATTSNRRKEKQKEVEEQTD
ncbi:hypothetical protein PAXINDRAFT_157428 [Paxillus involutus ATCC 200175]|uniref:Uncharacterized protein n=1 Tax=Paxillus involutus ATCC 200175 TaxID=664439 RepID=A0A0C9SSB2_PAXIN|nr:hypothetical protein PAXINDRAFT_157428 [Paxillus involutus ATCC 200175]